MPPEACRAPGCATTPSPPSMPSSTSLLGYLSLAQHSAITRPAPPSLRWNPSTNGDCIDSHGSSSGTHALGLPVVAHLPMYSLLVNMLRCWDRELRPARRAAGMPDIKRASRIFGFI